MNQMLADSISHYNAIAESHTVLCHESASVGKNMHRPTPEPAEIAVHNGSLTID